MKPTQKCVVLINKQFKLSVSCCSLDHTVKCHFRCKHLVRGRSWKKCQMGDGHQASQHKALIIVRVSLQLQILEKSSCRSLKTNGIFISWVQFWLHLVQSWKTKFSIKKFPWNSKESKGGRRVTNPLWPPWIWQYTLFFMYHSII